MISLDNYPATLDNLTVNVLYISLSGKVPPVSVSTISRVCPVAKAATPAPVMLTLMTPVLLPEGIVVAVPEMLNIAAVAVPATEKFTSALEPWCGPTS